MISRFCQHIILKQQNCKVLNVSGSLNGGKPLKNKTAIALALKMYKSKNYSLPEIKKQQVLAKVRFIGISDLNLYSCMAI